MPKGEIVGYIVKAKDIDALKELLDLKPWQLDRLGYWLDQLHEFRK